MIKSVVFDLDGTLVNTLYDLADCCNKTLEKFGFSTHETEKYRQFVGNGVFVLAKRILPATSSETLVSEVVASFRELYSQHYCDKSVPYENVILMLSKLKNKGLKLGVVSNKPHEFTVLMIKKLFGDGLFDFVAGQRDNVPKKPDPAGVIECLNLFGEKKENAVYVGDSNVDVLTAHNSGLKCIGVEWGFRGKEELVNAGADVIVHDVDDLYDYIVNRG